MSCLCAVERARQLLFAEARALDDCRWDDWLAMLHPEVEYWVPAWKGESEITGDPDTELSLIYYSDRSGLQDRVNRLRSGRSAASVPPKRTAHSITNVLVSEASGSDIATCAVFHSSVYDTRSRQHHTFFGRYEHVFAKDVAEDTWKITAKKTVLLNDHVPGMIDFYCI